METLYVYDDETGEAWEVLGDWAGLFGDNGGDPDGNAWLPRQPLSKEDPEAVEVVERGLGEFTNAMYFGHPMLPGEDLYMSPLEELAQLLHIEDVLDLAQRTDDWEAFQNAVVGNSHYRVDLWAHYGAYGAMDEVWVLRFLREEEKDC